MNAQERVAVAAVGVSLTTSSGQFAMFTAMRRDIGRLLPGAVLRDKDAEVSSTDRGGGKKGSVAEHFPMVAKTSRAGSHPLAPR